MRLDVNSINTLYEYAAPTRGEFREVIGTVKFVDINNKEYETLIMT